MEDQVVHRKYATDTKSRSNKLGIRTWNVQGLNKPGKFHVLEEELKKIAIMGISETHWKTSGHFISNNNNLITCSINLNIIQVYAPTSTSTQEESENFYRKMAETIEKCQNREILVVPSDFNAKDVKTYTGLECGSDHNALVAELSLKLRKPPKKIRATNRWDLQTNKEYRDRVSEIVAEISEECIQGSTANELWCKMKKCQKIKADEINNTYIHQRYNYITKEVNKALAKDKNEHIITICREVEAHRNQNESRDMFRKMRLLTKNFGTKQLPIEDDTGRVLTLKNEILNKWCQYCKCLMVDNENQSNEPPKRITDLTEPSIMRSEVEAAIRRLSKGKSAGSDGVMREIIGATSERETDILHHICNKIWTTGDWPTEWTESIYIPLHKKRSKQKCSNYRTISLINHASKIMRRAMTDWNGIVSVGGRKMSNLRYADDTTLLATTEEEMAELLQRVERYSEKAGLKLNRSKCCLMTVDRQKVLPNRFQTIQDLERKDELTYLGVQISNKGNCVGEIKKRISMAKTALSSLTRVWKDHHVNKETKKRLV
ncbi:uncharacterized protein LOC143894254 [Temnothorax americanus]|uniref:uncharacterized protein LOC143894254 n=1 Tax=Temnothorax americanus TaxID=1964332 RepID=UPI00406781E5